MPVSINEVWSTSGYPLGRLKRCVMVADNATVYRVPIVNEGRMALRDMDETTVGGHVNFVTFTVEFIRETKLLPQPDSLDAQEVTEERKVFMVPRLREVIIHPHFIIDPDLDILIGRMVGASNSEVRQREIVSMTSQIKKLEDEIVVHRMVRKQQKYKLKDQEKRLKAKGELGEVSNLTMKHTPKRVIQLGDD